MERTQGITNPLLSHISLTQFHTHADWYGRVHTRVGNGFNGHMVTCHVVGARDQQQRGEKQRQKVPERQLSSPPPPLLLLVGS